MDEHRFDDDGGHVHHPTRHKVLKRRFYRAARAYMEETDETKLPGRYLVLEIAHKALRGAE